MNRHVVSLLVAAITLLLLPVMAQAIDAPHDTVPVSRGGHGFTCNSCHAVMSNPMGTSPGYVFNNLCLTCHKTSGGSASRLPFNIADPANPLDTYTGPRPGIPYQTSHNWYGKDNVPSAGAVAPTGSLLNYPPSLNGVIACARCHGIHGKAWSTNASAPFLRGLVDQDQICLDCHRPRRTSTHLTGSHPVEINYSAVAGSHPNNYNNPPVSANPANYTASMNLKNGALLCTTCHGVHYTDSNSRTFDNNSAARNLQGRLSTSRGYLLRTDMRGTANNTQKNICTNCHKTNDDTTGASVKNHNGKGQNVQCADCHGGHVDAADGTTPNVYLVRRFMNISTQFGAVRNSKVLYQYTSAANKNFNKNANGVCLACHSPLPDSVAQHTSTEATVCVTCHSHNKGFSADCTSCHGYPPNQNVAAGPNGYAKDGVRDYSTSGKFKDESKTPHSIHAGGQPYAYSCDECHKGYSATHNTGTFQDVFAQADTALISNGKSAGLTPSYTNTGNGTCSTYCHSNGNPAGGPFVAKAVSWGSTKGTIIGKAGECSACHDAAATLATNAHGKHVNVTTGKGYACSYCHAATVNISGAVIDQTKHVDGVKDLLFSGSVGPNTLSGTNCANIYCHSNGRNGAPVTSPVWTSPSTGQCGACHAYPMANFGHTGHLTATYGPKFGTTAPGACNSCHTYTNEMAASHIDGNVDMVTNGCVTCHPVAGTYLWTSTGRVTCDSCHSGATLSVIGGQTAPRKDIALFTSGGHGQAGANYNASRDCESCHNNNSDHIGVAGGTKRLLWTTNNNSFCASCHDAISGKVPTAGKQDMKTHVISHAEAVSGNPSMNCKVCHDVHGTSNLHMILTTITWGAVGTPISFTNLSTGYVKNTVGYDGLCQTCHTSLKYFNKGQPFSSFSHPTKNCLSCHSHKAGTYAFKPQACNECHGYPPVPVGYSMTTFNYQFGKVEDYNSGGGAHAVAGHVKPTATPTEGWTNCAICHSNGSLNPSTHMLKNPPYPPNKPTQIDITIDIDDNYKFNDKYPLTRNQYSGPLSGMSTIGNTTGTCSNVSCHFQRSPRWGSL